MKYDKEKVAVCPKCGKVAHVWVYGHGESQFYRVCCDRCLCVSGDFKSRPAAIRSWNRWASTQRNKE